MDPSEETGVSLSEETKRVCAVSDCDNESLPYRMYCKEHQPEYASDPIQTDEDDIAGPPY